ncbi:extracellular solute-binding protein [Streptomyces sp. NA04227]|uniref:extracellular solute-binding protein n=1 Tax=Streptomyces sp. NA04227 TaxID=2742136 RepID=UPI0015904CED|nr:extracellular solute-binding protein [Streptomyces sp. NA04227]QKW10391.1 extracellular solute-binding protein [Streptomyces sp. NA04227]
MSSTQFDRRALLRLTTGALAATAAAPLLSACGDGGVRAVPRAKDPALLPRTTVRRIGGLTPDLPGSAAGVPDGYFRYPAVPRRATRGTPLAGADRIKATAETFLPPPPGRGDNAAWQAIERLLGTEVDVIAVPSDDHATKFSTTVAGGNLPDIFQYPETGGVDNKAGFFAATCADLAPHLAGDRVAAYPNLAAIPRAAWQGAIFGEGLYGIPISRMGTGGAGFYRHDLFAAAGVGDLDEIADLDRFVELCKELTRPREDQYAIMAGATTLIAASAGAPKDWRLTGGGGFVHRLETEEFREAIAVARGLYKAGCYYPGTIGMSGAQKAKYTDMFKNGKAAYVYDGIPAYLTPGTGYIEAMAAIDKRFDPRPMRPVGQRAVAWLDNVALQNVHITRASEERVRELLAFADFMASPFGTVEYTLINYGVEGVDFHRDARGNPVLTKKGGADTAVPWKFFGSAVPALFSSNSARGVRHVHDAYRRLVPMIDADPTLRYSSPTWDSKGTGSLLTLESDGIKDLVSGRKPLSWFDDLRRDYLGAGGEKARREFEEAAQQSTRQGRKK